MAIFTTNFNELLLPGLRKVYGLEYAQYPEEYSKVFDVQTSDKATEKEQSITGFGNLMVKPEGASVAYDQAFQGYKKEYTHVTYGLGFIITREMWEDDQYRQMVKLPRALARSVRNTTEIFGASVFNNAFTAGYVGADGIVLCATNHPLIGGGTFANKPAVDADLDITSFEQALYDIQAFVDDRGLKMAVRPKTLWVHPSNDFQAQYILKSDKLPDTADNNYNPARGALPYGILHWLTDPDAWFIQTDVSDGLTWFWRRRPEFTNDDDFDTENAKYKTTMRCSYGWTDPRCVYGSAGG